MGAMKPQSAQANKVTVLAVPLVIAVVECAAMLWGHAIRRRPTPCIRLPKIRWDWLCCWR